MAIGQVISYAIANPGTQAAAGIIGGPIALGGVSILAAIAGDIAGNIAANDLGNRMTQGLSKNPNILDNHDLIEAAGEAIAYILREVASYPQLTAIALSKNLPDPKRDLGQLAEKTPEYWLNINTNTADLSRGLNISEDQLTLIFSADAEEFDRVTALTTADWASFLNEFARRERKSLDAEIVEFVAKKLYATFPKAYRKVLKQDAAKGGEKFAAMLFKLHQIALAETQRFGAAKWGNSAKVGGRGNWAADLSSDGEIVSHRNWHPGRFGASSGIAANIYRYFRAPIADFFEVRDDY